MLRGLAYTLVVSGAAFLYDSGDNVRTNPLPERDQSAKRYLLLPSRDEEERLFAEIANPRKNPIETLMAKRRRYAAPNPAPRKIIPPKNKSGSLGSYRIHH